MCIKQGKENSCPPCISLVLLTETLGRRALGKQDKAMGTRYSANVIPPQTPKEVDGKILTTQMRNTKKQSLEKESRRNSPNRAREREMQLRVRSEDFRVLNGCKRAEGEEEDEAVIVLCVMYFVKREKNA
jgi:hypothetical protein